MNTNDPVVNDVEDTFRGSSPLNDIDWKLAILDEIEAIGADEPVVIDNMSESEEKCPVGGGCGSVCSLKSDAHPDRGCQNAKAHKEDSHKKGGAIGGIALVKRRKKPKGMPKRPLSAYNLFFQSERPKIVEESEQQLGKTSTERISFEALGRVIGKRWKELDERGREQYEKLAEKDSERYKSEMKAYKEAKKRKLEDAKALEETEKERANPRPPVPNKKKARAVSDAAAPPPVSAFQPANPVRARLPGSATPSPTPAKVVAATPSPTYPNHAAALQSSNAPRRTYPPAQHGSTTTTTSEDHHQQHRQHQPGPHPWYGNYVTPPTAYRAMFGTAPSIKFSPPPPPPYQEPVPAPENKGGGFLPVPPGMELYLPDPAGRERKYMVTYKFYSMPKKAAQEYMSSLEESARSSASAPAHGPQFLPPPPTSRETTPRMGPRTASDAHDPQDRSQPSADASNRAVAAAPPPPPAAPHLYPPPPMMLSPAAAQQPRARYF